MLIRRSNQFYSSDALGDMRTIALGFSTRLLGDMRQKESREKFLRSLNLPTHALIMPQQVHGNLVVEVSDSGVSPVPMADGLVMKRTDHVTGSLGIIVADCVPLLLADVEKNIIAATHAGWKGTLAHIAENTVDAMANLGANRKDIVVVVGPHIGSCCYSVGIDRVRLFESEFGKNPKMAMNRKETWYLDIGYLNKMELMRAGVRGDHIDSADLCTHTMNDTFFSYRRDTKQSFGEILAVIGFTS